MLEPSSRIVTGGVFGVALVLVLTAASCGQAGSGSGARGAASTGATPPLSFARPMNFPWDYRHVESLAVGDLNADGLADVVVGLWSGDVVVYLNRGDGRFRASRSYPATRFPSSVAIGDLNGDGKPDLAAGNEIDSGTVAVLLNRGGGSFGRSRLYRVGSLPRVVAMGDLDGDGKPDLVAANFDSSSVSELKNRGDGTFEAWRSYHKGDGFRPWTVALGDLTGDGKVDVVTLNSIIARRPCPCPFEGTLSLLVNKGDGTLAAAHTYRLGLGLPQDMQIVDLDGDGKPELIVSAVRPGKPAAKILVFHNDGGGELHSPRRYRTAGAGLAVGDLNGDGSPDLATDGVSVLVNRGDGTFSSPETLYQNPAWDRFHEWVAIANLTADRRPDVAYDRAVLANTTGR